MFKRIIVFALLAALLCGVLAACDEGKGDYLEEQDAVAIVLKDLGIKTEDATSIHVHVGTHDNQPCFNVYITYKGVSKTYIVSSISGDILSIEDGSGHSH